MNIGDRIRVTEYKTFTGKVIDQMTGLEGTVVAADEELDYVDVLMDDEVAGLTMWLFLPEEIEVI